jgi:hypothetical protein
MVKQRHMPTVYRAACPAKKRSNPRYSGPGGRWAQKAGLVMVPETEALALEVDIVCHRALLPGLKIQGFRAEEIL